jgi:hypothetical protein
MGISSLYAIKPILLGEQFQSFNKFLEIGHIFWFAG